MKLPEEEIQKQHRFWGIECNGEVWSLLDKEQRTAQDNFIMLHAAHASLYHWCKVGKPANITRGEWMLSRVYAVLGEGDRALYHAQNAKSVCDENEVEDFDVAYAHEALMRSYYVLNNTSLFTHHKNEANNYGKLIKDPEDQKIFIGDMGEFWMI